MRRGEVWLASLEEEAPVVLLEGGEGGELRGMRIVPPATPAEKIGFVVLSGEEALDHRATDRTDGIEVPISDVGVVRVALPRDGHVFCTWLITLTPDHLVRRMGALSPEELHQLDNALRLSAIE